jgi:hypothetical protein
LIDSVDIASDKGLIKVTITEKNGNVKKFEKK